MTKKLRMPKSYKLGHDKDGETIIIPIDESGELTEKDIAKKNACLILDLKTIVILEKASLSILHTKLGIPEEFEKDYSSLPHEDFAELKEKKTGHTNFPSVIVTGFAPAIINLSVSDHPLKLHYQA